MDAVNERKVFKRITKSSCGNLLPQYFLITPKLITGLEYHRDVKVLVILNGTGGLPQKGILYFLLLECHVFRLEHQ